ncbi:MAG: RcpC/CpaB family pilus assembly protein [Thermoleophilaceae bacterium]
MSPSLRRRRAALLLALALASGGLAASEVRGRVVEVEGRTGAPVPVVTAAVDLPAGTVLGSERSAAALEVRRVPAAYVPPDALSDAAAAAGLRLGVALPRGGYLTAGALASGGDGAPEEAPGPALARGERAVEIAVAGAGGRAAGAVPGARVDVLVTTEDGPGGGRTYVALEDVELLDLHDAEPGDASPEGAAAPRALATLRVAAADAAFLVAAQSFAREVRLLARPPGDRRPLRDAAVARGDL